MQVFANSCGKIFQDRIVFASAHREKEIKVEKIAKLKFVMGFELKSLLWVALCSSIFFMVHLDKNIDGVIYFLVMAVGLAFTTLALVKAERNYHIMLQMKDGSKNKIRVAKNNKKEAKKFVETAAKAVH